jgi:hypothetical protein
MRSHSKMTAGILTGAVVLAGAAYGLGTQVGGGEATAASGTERPAAERFCGPGLAFDGLADELGVDETKLREALRDFHEQNGDDAREAFAAALAAALGKPADEVEQALESARPPAPPRPFEGDRPPRPGAPLRDLARALDVSRAELREALTEVRSQLADDAEARRGELVKFLAERLGLSEEKVEQALPERPGLGDGPGPGFAPGPPPGP